MKKKQDKKSYPLIKRLFRKEPPASGVYAGPDHFRKHPAPMEDVYAGPEAEMEDVYAGPEYYERDPDEDKRPRKRPRVEPPMKCVYAGPNLSARRPIPPKEMDIDPPKPPIQPMECVYAGPEYWDPSLKREPVPAPSSEDVDPDTIPEECDDVPSRLVRLPEEEPDLGDEG